MNAQPLAVTGYVDRWSAYPGESLQFYVSCLEANYEVELVRLIHGDESPLGPGVKEATIEHDVQGRYPGRGQSMPLGSCVVAENLPPVQACTLQLWLMPTLPARGREQGLASWGDAGGKLEVLLDRDGHIEVRVEGTGSHRMLQSASPLDTRCWHFIAVTISPDEITLYHHCTQDPPSCPPMFTQSTGSLPGWTISSSTALFAALELEHCGRVQRPRGGFNGKLEAPLLFGSALSAPQVLALLNEGPRGPIASTALAQWDFVAEAHSAQVPDRSIHHRHAHTLNRPLRLVPGRFFSGRTITPREAPGEFNAAHFHEDDLADAGWELSHTVQIPADFRSGLYALKLRAGNTVDHIPFCVRAPRQGPRAGLAVLVPTVSYMVYSNIGMDPAILPPELRPLSNLDHANTAHARYARENRLLSCYDQHADGSGVAIVSLLRPQLMACRPDDRSTFNDSPHQLGADLHLIDWLETKGIAYDVLTDHDLHREGAAALLPYQAVLSGTHAEYWTSTMRQGLLDYTAQGGRFVYLSGNGLYWVTALSEDGTLAEVRRPHGTRAWTAEPGAAYISLTGELGGLWMHRGLAPQSAVGVGFSSQGFGPGRPYRRTPASFTPRFSFLFKDIDDELIGDMPALVSGYGAAGYEVDRVDLLLGTPHHATVLASATEFSDCYQYVIENMPAMMPGLGGSTCPEVRADLVYYDTPNDGAVFSTGSIAWCSTLSWNHYDNTVSRLTENIIRAFLTPGPLPGAAAS